MVLVVGVRCSKVRASRARPSTLGDGPKEEVDEDRLSAFKDFVNTLDLDDLDDEEE